MYRTQYEPRGAEKILLSAHQSKSNRFYSSNPVTEYLHTEANTGGHVRASLSSLKSYLGRDIHPSEYDSIIVEDGFVYLRKLWEEEQFLAKKIIEIQNANPERNFKSFHSDYLFPNQNEAVKMVTENQISIINGPPGVGKTTVAIAIINAAREAGMRIEAMAPTGKASSRLQEVLLNWPSLTAIRPKTIHRALEWTIKEEGDKEGFPVRGTNFPIDANLIICDESSMIHLSLMASLFAAIQPGTRIVLIGDINQLPPVGPGQPFIDMIKSQIVPIYTLNDVVRQAKGSKIWLACQAILDESPYKFFQLASKDDDEIAFNHIQSSENIRKYIRYGLEKFSEAGKDPFNNLQILTPLKEKGEASSTALNEMASKIINREKSLKIKLANNGTGREGDKVTQLKNNYSRDVFNGDQGRIQFVGKKPIIISGVRRRKQWISWSRWPRDDEEGNNYYIAGVNMGDHYLPYNEEEALNELSLAYALTVHKYQGSEAPHVVVACPVEAWGMMGRRLLLTAISRAKKRVVIAGPTELITRAITTDRDSSRRTGLAEKLKQ